MQCNVVKRLLKGPKGFAHLRTHTKFTLQSRLTGKPGHETADLAEIVTFFQEWAKLLFPKATLTEFLKKVEDLCDSKLMKVQRGRANTLPDSVYSFSLFFVGRITCMK